MRENSLAKRYARAMIKSVKNEKEYLDIKKELEQFSDLMRQNAELKAGMETFLFSQNQKKEVLDTIHKKVKFKEKTVNFLISMVEENRMMVLDSIIQMLEELWFEANGIEKLKVYSAVALSKKLETQLVKSLEKSFEKTIVIEKEVDPTLIAGIKVQRGSIYYDFSIEGNLKKLKDALLTDSDMSVGEH
ncbi:MAG: ATP synthase F1 subunit delta [bacterium]|nr:ATP synthase F1 subunit delta [bacterium]